MLFCGGHCLCCDMIMDIRVDMDFIVEDGVGGNELMRISEVELPTRIESMIVMFAQSGACRVKKRRVRGERWLRLLFTLQFGGEVEFIVSVAVY